MYKQGRCWKMQMCGQPAVGPLSRGIEACFLPFGLAKECAEQKAFHEALTFASQSQESRYGVRKREGGRHRQCC